MKDIVCRLPAPSVDEWTMTLLVANLATTPAILQVVAPSMSIVTGLWENYRACAYKGDGGWAPLMDNSPNDKRIYITFGDINLLYPKWSIVHKGSLHPKRQVTNIGRTGSTCHRHIFILPTALQAVTIPQAIIFIKNRTTHNCPNPTSYKLN